MSITDRINEAQTNAAAAIAAGAAMAEPSFHTVGDVPVVVLPEDRALSSLEAYLPAPARLKQGVSLSTPHDLAAYVNLFGHKGRTLIFADRAVSRVTAILDYHTSAAEPSWNEHRAECSLRPTPAFKDWAAQNGKASTQAEFAQFLEDHIPDIVTPDGATLLEVCRNFEARKSVTFQSSQRVADGSVQFTFNEDVQGAARAGALKVPTEFVVLLAPYEGLLPRPVTARLRYRIGAGGKLAIWFDLVRLQDVMVSAFDEVVELVRVQTRDAVRAVVLGSI